MAELDRASMQEQIKELQDVMHELAEEQVQITAKQNQEQATPANKSLTVGAQLDRSTIKIIVQNEIKETLTSDEVYGRIHEVTDQVSVIDGRLGNLESKAARKEHVSEQIKQVNDTLEQFSSRQQTEMYKLKNKLKEPEPDQRVLQKLARTNQTVLNLESQMQVLRETMKLSVNNMTSVLGQLNGQVKEFDVQLQEA